MDVGKPPQPNWVLGGIMKIGVVLPFAEDSDAGGMPSYVTIRERALHAEAAGFDSIWLYDHLLFRFPDQSTVGIWEIWTVLSALAEATQRVEIGTVVLCVPFRNPAILAKMADTLDEVSGGRLILGLGAGWHQPEFDAFGVPFDYKAARFEEALQIITPLLREGRVDFRGTYYAAPNCELRPRGPRPRGLPVLVASTGPRMLRLTAQYADSWNTAWLGPPEPLAARRADLETACVDVGRDPKTLEVTVGINVSYKDTEDAPGTETPPRLSGSPQKIAAALDAYRTLGVGHLICGLAPDTPASMSAFAEAVALHRASA